MKNGFLKVCTLSPALRVADCAYNTQETIAAMQQAAQDGAALAVFPELGLTGYTCSDLFLQQPLLDAAEQGLRDILRASETLELVAVVGLPVRVDGALYNCAAVVCHGALLGLVPKTHLPNYAEFYELRHFTPAPAETRSVTLCGASVPFGTDLLFRCREMPDFCLGVEICEDLWAPLPPSTRHALAGATVLANLSASDETVGKAEYRRQLVGQQSARLLSAYLYADAGHGESTTDMVFAAHDLICENGALLAEAKPFGTGRAEAVLDLGRMQCERRRSTTFCPNAAGHTTVPFSMPLHETALTRPVSPTPFVPSDAGARAERCELILEIQADGLAKRLEHAHARTAVLGISGGLDSAMAEIAKLQKSLADVMNRLKDPTSQVISDLSALCGRIENLSSLLNSAEDLSAAIRHSSADLRDILDDVEDLQDILDDYEPVLQDTLKTVSSLSTSAIKTIRDTQGLISDTEALMKSTGATLDDGTKQTLEGLAAVLRSTAKTMGTAGQIKDAKTSICDIIEDTWDEYTGDVNNLLLMDATADAVSLTDSRNPSPESIQILIRTQEITMPDEDETEAEAAAEVQTTFWGRVAQMFKDFWAAITGLFGGKD